ncbi:unnamed protein product [Phaeothamnion confervicola]
MGETVVDVYVTHWSLSLLAREQSALAILKLADAGTGDLQILLGDLNAEPHEASVGFLRGDAMLGSGDGCDGGGDGDSSGNSGNCGSVGGIRGDFKDAWLELHAEPPLGSTEEKYRNGAFTFPSNNPTKRIDYVFYRVGPAARQGTASSVTGQAPTAATTHLATEGAGMLDDGGPVWASDHRAVVADILLLI